MIIKDDIDGLGEGGDREGRTFSDAMISGMISDVKKSTHEAMEKIKLVEIQVSNEKVSLISIFGIFASVISFLTIEFQFLQKVSGLWGIVGFSCVLFALLLGFNIGLDYLIKNRFDKDAPIPHEGYLRLIVIVFFIGCLAISCGNEWKEIIRF